MSSQKVDLIRQALGAAESSIRLAKQLLQDLERDGHKGKSSIIKESPGVMGIFDGQELVTEKGERYPVPENYASKSILVVGDTLKLVEEGKEKRFKQIEHVKRHKTNGILTKKEGKWTAVTPEGSYKLLPASVAHFNAGVGDEALLQLPATNLQVPWAAVERITKKADGSVVTEPKVERKAEKPPANQPVKNEKEVAPKHEEVKAKVVESKPQPEKQEEKIQAPKEENHPPKEEKPKEPKPEPKVEKKEEPKPVEIKEPEKVVEKPVAAPPVMTKPAEKAPEPLVAPVEPKASVVVEEEEELA